MPMVVVDRVLIHILTPTPMHTPTPTIITILMTTILTTMLLI